MELFDFAKIVAGFIEFNGSWNPANTFVNVYLKREHEEARNLGRSIFGRSNNVDIDAALIELANDLSLAGKIQFGQVEYNVPTLTHTRGYRGKRGPNGGLILELT